MWLDCYQVPPGIRPRPVPLCADKSSYLKPDIVSSPYLLLHRQTNVYYHFFWFSFFLCRLSAKSCSVKKKKSAEWSEAFQTVTLRPESPVISFQKYSFQSIIRTGSYVDCGVICSSHSSYFGDSWPEDFSSLESACDWKMIKKTLLLILPLVVKSHSLGMILNMFCVEFYAFHEKKQTQTSIKWFCR